MSSFEPRPISDDEFIVAFRDLTIRLDSHIKLVAGGDLRFRNDLAGVVRILLGRDKANQAVKRFCKRFGQPEPRVAIFGSAREGEHTILHLAALPTTDDDDEGHRLNISTELMSQVAIVVRAAKSALRFTWQAVIDDYGNSFGAHLTRTVPRILDATRFYGVGPTDIGTYMLWSIGIAASAAAHELLVTSDSSHVPAAHGRYLAGTEITEVLYLREGGKDDLRARVRREDWSVPGPLISMPSPSGQHLLLSVSDGGKLRLTVIEPEGADK